MNLYYEDKIYVIADKKSPTSKYSSYLVGRIFRNSYKELIMSESIKFVLIYSMLVK